MGKDLRVQIAGDETQLNRALTRAEGRLAKYDASVRASAAAQEKSYATAGQGAAQAGASAERYAAVTEASNARVKRSMTETLAAHSATMQKIGSSTMTAGRAVSSAGSSILSVVTPIGLVGAAAGKMAIDFSAAMETLHTQAKYSQREVDELSKSVLKLSPQLGVGPKEIAEGLYHVASAGFKAQEAMAIVKEAMMGARLGMASADETTYALVSILKAAPKDIHSAADAMGVMNTAVGEGDLRMQDFVDALSTGIIPRAKAAGLGFRDVAVALDVLTKRGIPAQMGSTRLAQTFAYMEKQSKTAEGALESIGITQGQLGKAMEGPNGLLTALELVRHHLDGTGKSLHEQNEIILKVFGGGRSSGAIQTLLENMGELRKEYEKFPTAARGVEHLNKVWADLQHTPAQEAKKEAQELNVDLIKLGQEVLPVVLPLAKELAHDVGVVSEEFAALSPHTKRLVVDATLAAGAFGIIAKPVGGLITAVGSFGRGLGAAGAGVAKWTKLVTSRVEETVPVAEAAGAEAGAAWGAAFASSATRGVAEVNASMKMSGATAAEGRFMTPWGYGYPTGGAPRGTRVAGFGPAMTAAEQDAVLGADGYRSSPAYLAANRASRGAQLKGLGTDVASGAKTLGRNALKGGFAGLTLGLGATAIGELLGGRPGHDIKTVGTDTAIGTAIGTTIAPGVGTAVGAALGTIVGLVKTFGSTSGSEAAHRLANTPGGPHLGGKAEDTFARLTSREEDAIGRLRNPGTLGTRGAGATGASAGNRQERARIEREYDPKLGTALGKEEEHYLLNGTKFPDVLSIVATAKTQLAQLGPAGKKAYAQMMVEGLKELEHGQRVQKGSVQQFLTDVGHQYAGLKGIAGKDSKAAAEVLAQELQGKKALQSAEGFVNELHKHTWSQIPEVANLTSSEAGSFFKTNLDKLTGIIVSTTGLQKLEAERAYKKLRDQGIGYFGHMRSGIEAELTSLSHHMGPMSAKGIGDLETRYKALAEVIENEVEAGVLTTAEGTQKIDEIFQSEGKTLGINIVHAGLNAVAIANKAISTATPKGKGSGKAGGGWIGHAGEQGRDEVPIWVGRGEAVVNHDQQPYVQTGLAVSKLLGLQPYGSLDELYAQEKKPHWMASGGIVAPHVTVPGAIGQLSQAVLNKEAAAANRLLDKARAANAVSTPAGAAPTGGGFNPGQLGSFDGLQVAKWIIPELAYARAHGWTGPVTSGYRAGFDPHAPGGSMHALDIYPGGAVDFGGMVDPAGLANRSAFIRATAGYAGRRLLTPIGFRDDGHMSGTGHASGGFVATAYGPPWGGIEGGGTTATGLDLHDAPHRYVIAVDPSVVPLGSNVKVWPNPFGYHGDFLAADTGGAIKGNRIDFYDWRGRASQDAWGIRNVTLATAGGSSGSASEIASLNGQLNHIKRERINLPTPAAGKAGAGTRAANAKARKRLANQELTIRERLKALHAAPKEKGLELTGPQEAHVQGLLGGASGDKAARTGISGITSELGDTLQRGEAKWAAHPNNLATGAGVRAATLEAGTVESVKKSQLVLYKRELLNLKDEAKNFAKLRDYFRHLARGLHGKAKKQALDKAASYQAKLLTAQNDAKTLGGTIASTEAEVTEAETKLAAIPGEAQSADLTAYQAANTHIDAEVRAGHLSEAEGKAAKEGNARTAIAGGYGQLSPDGLLQVEGDLHEFSQATTEATSALQAHTQAIEEATKAVREQTNARNQISQVEAGSLAKSLADLISGQIAGRGYYGRSQTPGSGVAARY